MSKQLTAFTITSMHIFVSKMQQTMHANQIFHVHCSVCKDVVILISWNFKHLLHVHFHLSCSHSALHPPLPNPEHAHCAEERYMLTLCFLCEWMVVSQCISALSSLTAVLISEIFLWWCVASQLVQFHIIYLLLKLLLLILRIYKYS